MSNVETGVNPLEIWTPICEWCAVKVWIEDQTLKDICLEEIGLHSQIMLTILCESTINRFGTIVYVCLMSTQVFTLVISRIFIRVSKHTK